MSDTFNRLIAGIPVEMIDAPNGINIPCEQCFVAEAEFAVGVTDHQLVCEPCLSYGDRRRWWHREPRQKL